MGLTATVSFDLHGANPKKYGEFYVALEAKQWEKKPAANTTVFAMFRSDVNYDSVVATTKSDFDSAARAVGVTYSAELVVGYPPVELP